MNKMIKTVLPGVALAMTTVYVKAQDLNTMLNDTYKSFETATNMGSLMKANNSFNLIAAKWGNDWAANYYAAYSAIVISLQETNPQRKDQLLDQADRFVEKVNSIQPANDESMVLAAYATFARFLVDPPNRWKKYLALMNDDLGKAKKVNPDNPRIYYLEGIPVFNKPVLWGGGKSKAKPYFEKAKALFAKQPPASITKPYWGEKDNADYLTKCD